MTPAFVDDLLHLAAEFLGSFLGDTSFLNEPGVEAPASMEERHMGQTPVCPVKRGEDEPGDLSPGRAVNPARISR